jgi:hypothetical protein
MKLNVLDAAIDEIHDATAYYKDVSDALGTGFSRSLWILDSSIKHTLNGIRHHEVSAFAREETSTAFVGE